MSHPLAPLAAFALAVLLVTPALLLADTETVSGMVEEVDLDHGCLKLWTDGGDSRELTVPKKLLSGVEPGDRVTVWIVDGKVTALSKSQEV